MVDEVQRELELEASLADAWRAVTDPAWLSQWLADEVELEARPGGEARFRLGEEVRTGWVEELTAPDGEEDAARLVFWWAADEEPASRVELELTALEDGRTRLRVAETRPLEVLDLVGIPLPGASRRGYGPALVAA